ncbi:MAG: TetR/AcrR family transcriptional regulator [Lacisediminihabitans sp.]
MTDVWPKSSRGADRRALILRSAADLMAERGYSAVSMTQIGAAAGIVGSGVYRHFDSKATILGALLERVIDAMRSGTRDIIGASETGPARLDAMIRKQTEIVIENRSLVAVYLRDAGNLPADESRRLRRQQRQLIGEWVRVCGEISPRSSESELRMVVQAVLALINSTCTYDNRLPADRIIASITEMASSALRTGVSAP